MRLLLLHTAAAESSVALVDTEQPEPVVATATLPGRSASERLVLRVAELLAQQNWVLAQLDGVGVVHGPGSFTGVRVGLSAAKGLCEATGLPLVAVSRLALVAAAAGQAEVRVVLDAGRSQYFVGHYRAGSCLAEALLEAAAVAVDTDAVPLVTTEAAVASAQPARLIAEPGAAALWPLVLARLQRGEVDDASLLDANYLRHTDVEIQARLSALGKPSA
ncbi:MAG: tRNA (adenosine(37)-N6)-threonylcarbamoyltransferase complex dimerization subunit type 1 TsaB [Acidobacteriota bacterium]|nr:tRNA (adenosine(37)-N6)-threonylcarbamoyltransferase complex dimerization subunit type 1 TsaB [Acidobacteriota bacterium]